MQYIVLDTETGGLDPSQHSLLSVAMIKTTTTWQEVDSFSVKIRHPVFCVDAKAMEINNIDIREAPSWCDATTAKKRIIEFLGVSEASDTKAAYTLCGTNIQFDVGFMKVFLTDPLFNKIFYHRVEEITSNFRELQKTGIIPAPRGYKLYEMLEALGIDFEHDKLHDAMYDAECALKAAREMHMRTMILKDSLSSYVEVHGGELSRVLRAYRNPVKKQKLLMKLRSK